MQCKHHIFLEERNANIRKILKDFDSGNDEKAMNLPPFDFDREICSGILLVTTDILLSLSTT
jgi:hypothetical protein